MLPDPTALVAAFALSLLGAGHCVAMCGGLASALGLQQFPNPFKASVFYHLGRITSYVLAGVSIGLIGFWLADGLNLLIWLRYASAMMLILIGLYIGQWLNVLVVLERGGRALWNVIQPLGRRFLRPSSLTQCFALGMVWGWLPCGLVYSALVYAAAQANPMSSALIMLVFGLGTLPVMLSLSIMGQKLRPLMQAAWFKKLCGALLCAYGVWSLWGLHSLNNSV